MSNFGLSKSSRMLNAINAFIDESHEECGPNKSTDLLCEFLEGVTVTQLEVLFDCVMAEVTTNDL